jgi:hypothetical protein
MSSLLFGQILGRHVSLDDHDIEEILHEQKVASRRFGEVALMLGLVSSEHVLRAWIDQLADGPRRVDLAEIGVDAQYLSSLPAALVRAHNVLPVRGVDEFLIIAAARPLSDETLHALTAATGKTLRIALVDESQLQQAIARYLPASEPKPGRTEAA